MALALEKLEKGVESYPMRDGTEATASLFIVNPFRRSNIAKWLSTHPPTQERVQKLRSLIL